MKNKLFLILCFTLTLFSCQKENDLENEQLSENVFEDGGASPFVSIEGFQLDCLTIYLNVELNNELLGDGFQYTHLLIEDPFKDIIRTTKQRFVPVRAKCNALNNYKLYLYDAIEGKTSKGYSYSFRTSS